MQVLASGGLDEHEILRLTHDETAPIDGFGVGSALGASDDVPVLDSVYKLVAYDGRPVRKTSTGKEIWPGPKQVWRAPDWSVDVIALADEPAPEAGQRPLLVEVMRGGRRTSPGQVTLTEANRNFEQEWAGLPGALKDLTARTEHPLTVSSRLRLLAAKLDQRQKMEDEE